jgi:hypothetical protein
MPCPTGPGCAGARIPVSTLLPFVSCAVAEAVRIAIDLNVRIGADLTYSGFDDITGAVADDLPQGTSVQVHEPESGACGPAVVAWRDFGRRLIYVHVEWGQLRCG